MPKKKVSLFFDTEKEEENRAYEILCSFGKKKSVNITRILNKYAGKLSPGEIHETKTPEIPVAKKLQTDAIQAERKPDFQKNPVTTASNNRKEEEKKHPVVQDPPNEPERAEASNEGKKMESREINKNLVLKGLAVFGR